MESVYLAGRINGCSDADCVDWRRRAKELLGAAVTVLDPMSRDYRGREVGHEAAIVEGDKEDITSSTVVLVHADAPSWGTAMEVHFAHAIGKPVVVVCTNERPSPWLVYHCTSVHKTIEGGVAAVKEFINR